MPAPDPILDFYEPLTPHYHLLFDDWDQAIARQSRILEPLLSAHAGPGPLKILDCACGIGTQTLGFAAAGHHVTASDLSPAEVTRARLEAASRSLSVDFYVADMTTLTGIHGPFDVIAALDNALPHLTQAQLAQAIPTIASRLKPGGLFLASIRDYDHLIVTRPEIQPPAYFGTIGRERIVHQLWDWTDSDAYTVHLYLTQQLANGWQSFHFVSHYRALLRQELNAVLERSGFEQIQWLSSQESGYYQPIILARKT